MKTKLYISFIVLLALNLSIIGGDRKRYDRTVRQLDANTVVNTIPYNINPESVVFLPMQLAQGFETDSMSIGPEISTGISGFYDYKTNGESNVYIQVNPTNPLEIQVIDVQADSTDPAGASTRRTKWTFSTNGGTSWEPNINVPDIRSGFCVIELRNGAGVIANHNTAIAGQLNTNLYVDIVPLAGSFTEYGHPSPAPFGIWPQIAVYNNGNVGMLGRRNSGANGLETLYYSFWNGTTLGAWTPVYFTGNNWQGTVGSNMRFHLGTNGAGRVTMIIAPVLSDDTLFNSKVYQRTSTDNGANWGPVTTIFTPYGLNGGADTVATAGGSGFTCKPNSTRWVYATPITTDNLYEHGRILSIRDDGDTAIIATASQVGATITYNQAMSFVFNLDFPTLGWSADGSTLYCIFSVTMPDTSRGYNQRDLFCSYSLNEGSTWSNPIRLTNTPTIDESYPSVSRWNKGSSGNTYELNLVYMKDPGVGPTSFGGTAPASRNTLVYRKLTAINVIGISNNQTLLKDYHLAQNFPNPFNPSTMIEYNLVKSGLVTLKVYDIIGREVATLVNEVQTTGVKEVEFNAANLPSGIYFYTINTGGFTDTKKMILVK
jgi:Secretion system C-terminal sorting domain